MVRLTLGRPGELGRPIELTTRFAPVFGLGEAIRVVAPAAVFVERHREVFRVIAVHRDGLDEVVVSAEHVVGVGRERVPVDAAVRGLEQRRRAAVPVVDVHDVGIFEVDTKRPGVAALQRVAASACAHELPVRAAVTRFVDACGDARGLAFAAAPCGDVPGGGEDAFVNRVDRDRPGFQVRRILNSGGETSCQFRLRRARRTW